PHTDQLGERPSDFGRDPVAVNVPPWPRVAKESALRFSRKALPQGLAVRAQAVDRGAPSNFRAAFAEPAPKPKQVAFGQVTALDGCRFEIGMAAGDQAPPR